MYNVIQSKSICFLLVCQKGRQADGERSQCAPPTARRLSTGSIEDITPFDLQKLAAWLGSSTSTSCLLNTMGSKEYEMLLLNFHQTLVIFDCFKGRIATVAV